MQAKLEYDEGFCCKTAAGPGTTKQARCADSVCGKVAAILLIAYGVFNTFLFFKFTPVYRATECGDQMGEMNNFELGNEIRVGLQIQVTCWNPNGYAVQIMASKPGLVFVGKDRESVVGRLSLVQGSNLPAKSSGNIRVHMDARLSEETSMSLVPHFLEDPEIPMYLVLQFDVAVSIAFLGLSLGTSAPFKKKCGMVMAGVLINTQSRLGPMICRETWEELSELPHVGEAIDGKMSFSAAQMDPDRIRLGEFAKNVSIIGIGGLCYVLGFVLLCQWCASIAEGCAHQPNLYGQVGRANLPGRWWCTRAHSGNLMDPQIDKTVPASAPWQPRSCFRGSSGNLVETTKPAIVDDSMITRATGFLTTLTPFSTAPVRTASQFDRAAQFDMDWENRAWEDKVPQPACECLVSPIWKFISCGRGGSRASGRPWPHPQVEFHP